MNKRRIILYIIGLCVAMTVVSCKILYVNQKKYEHLRPEKIFSNLERNKLKFNHLKIKFAVDIDINGKANSATAHLRMTRDSVIWMKISAVNIEIARLLVTPDSVKFINRFDKMFLVTHVDSLAASSQIDVDYNVLEAICSNSFFFYPPTVDTNKTLNDFRLCSDTNYHCMSSLSQRKQDRLRTGKHAKSPASPDDDDKFILQTVKVLPISFRVGEIRLHNMRTNDKLSVVYSNFYTQNDIFFPRNIDITLRTSKLNCNVKLTVASIDLDEPSLSFPFKISPKYKEIEVKRK